MDTGFFPIEDFNSERFPLLGEGVWGRVYDLRDGTVLKVSCETCAGIGSGGEKIAREAKALALLADVKAYLPFAVPVLCGYGVIPADSGAGLKGYDFWLHSTKIAGQRKEPADLSKKESEQMGEALAHLHKTLMPFDDEIGPGGDPFADIRTVIPETGFYAECLEILEKETNKIPATIRNYPAHNDFNPSNLLFQDGRLSGVLDFAEFGRNYPEKDISDIINENPALGPGIIKAYESVSGITIDPARIALGIAENGLYGAVIGERKRDTNSIRWGRETLRAELAKLGYNVKHSPSKALAP